MPNMADVEGAIGVRRWHLAEVVQNPCHWVEMGTYAVEGLTERSLWVGRLWISHR
jgi:hypothetical protein